MDADTAAQIIAESYPGWNTKRDYEANRKRMEKDSVSWPDYSQEDFDKALASLDARLDGVNAAALESAHEHVAALEKAGVVLLTEADIVALKAAEREHVAKGVEALAFLNVARLIREGEYIDNPRTGHKHAASPYASVLAVTQLDYKRERARADELQARLDALES